MKTGNIPRTKNKLTNVEKIIIQDNINDLQKILTDKEELKNQRQIKINKNDENKYPMEKTDKISDTPPEKKEHSLSVIT